MACEISRGMNNKQSFPLLFDTAGLIPLRYSENAPRAKQQVGLAVLPHYNEETFMIKGFRTGVP